MEIQIRSTEPGDVTAIRDIYSQPSCYANTLQLPHPSLDMWQQRMAAKNDNYHSFVAEIDGKVVGQIGMEVCPNPRRQHVANLGMGVCEQHQGKGAGSKLLSSAIELAEKWLAVRRIELEVFTDNKPAIALYKKHGFITEGTARAYAFRDGEYVDVFFMAKVSHPDVYSPSP